MFTQNAEMSGDVNPARFVHHSQIRSLNDAVLREWEREANNDIAR